MPIDLKDVREVELAAKRRAQAEMESAYANQGQAAGSAIHGVGELRAQQTTWTLADEQEKRLYDLKDQANRTERAMTFFREHPEFDLFIKLIRQGVIQI